MAQVLEKPGRIGGLAFKNYIATQPIMEAIKDQISPLVTNLGFILFVLVVIFLVLKIINKK